MIVDRYLLQQLSPVFLGVSAVLSVLFATFTLARFLPDANAGLLQLTDVFRITALRWLIALDILLPVALYLSVILVWGRLYQDLEIDALKAGGMSGVRMVYPLFGFGLILTGLVAWVSLQGRPWAWQQIYRTMAEAEASAEIQRIGSARFNTTLGGRTLFVDTLETGGVLRGLFIHRRQQQSLEILSAPVATFTPYVTPRQHQLTLHQALVFRQWEQGREITGRFDVLTLRFDAGQPSYPTDKAKAFTNHDLRFSEAGKSRAEWQWRLGAPASTLLLLAVAIPLVRVSPRQGRYGRLLLALAIYALFYNLSGVAKSWVEQGIFPFLGWTHGLLLLTAAFLWRNGLR